MKKQTHKTIGMCILLVILALAITPLAGLDSYSAVKAQGPETPPPNAPEATTVKLYLPQVMRNTLTTYKGIGAETCCSADPTISDKVKAANVTIARAGVFSWLAIEPTRTNPPKYDWSKAKNNLVKELTTRGISTVAMVRFTPSWAQKNPPYQCGPIKESAFDAFAQFLSEAVRIYSQPPYNIKYWEIGNEPDVSRNISVVTPDNPWGCWGEDTDYYYGGGYYAKMLEKAYPAIKNADPEAQVVLGGLLLDCDPTFDSSCQPGRFLEGVLMNNGKNNGANYFDIVSYHAYPHYYGKLSDDETYPKWAHRGGIVLGKANFIRELLAKYGASKPIYHSEGALICPETSSYCHSNPADNTQFREAQADYVPWLYVRNIATGIWATSWYVLEGPGWRDSSLLDANYNPKPAYSALQFLTKELTGATYSTQIYQYPELRVYEFRTSSKKIWIMWSPDDAPHTINLPTGTTVVYDKYGHNITPANKQLSIKSPVYVELK